MDPLIFSLCMNASHLGFVRVAFRAKAFTGLLLRNSNHVTITQKPYYLLHIPVMVT